MFTKSPKFQTAFDVWEDPGVDCQAAADGMVQEHFQEQTDVNAIMSKYLKTGVLPHVETNKPQYADVSDMPESFQQIMDLQAQSTQQILSSFADLPQDAQDHYKTPESLLAAIDDPYERGRLEAYGILKPADPSPPKTPQAADAAEATK